MPKTPLPLSVRRELWARIWQQLLQPPTTTERANGNREAH